MADQRKRSPRSARISGSAGTVEMARERSSRSEQTPILYSKSRLDVDAGASGGKNCERGKAPARPNQQSQEGGNFERHHSREQLAPRRSAEEAGAFDLPRSEEHTSELQSPCNLVCRLLLEKKKE